MTSEKHALNDSKKFNETLKGFVNGKQNMIVKSSLREAFGNGSGNILINADNNFISCDRAQAENYLEFAIREGYFPNVVHTQYVPMSEKTSLMFKCSKLSSAEEQKLKEYFDNYYGIRPKSIKFVRQNTSEEVIVVMEDFIFNGEECRNIINDLAKHISNKIISGSVSQLGSEKVNNIEYIKYRIGYTTNVSKIVNKLAPRLDFERFDNIEHIKYLYSVESAKAENNKLPYVAPVH